MQVTASLTGRLSAWQIWRGFVERGRLKVLLDVAVLQVLLPFWGHPMAYSIPSLWATLSALAWRAKLSKSHILFMCSLGSYNVRPKMFKGNACQPAVTRCNNVARGMAGAKAQHQCVPCPCNSWTCKMGRQKLQKGNGSGNGTCCCLMPIEVRNWSAALCGWCDKATPKLGWSVHPHAHKHTQARTHNTKLSVWACF